MENTKLISTTLLIVIALIALLTFRFRTGKQYEIRKLVRLFPFWVKYLGFAIAVISIAIHWRNLSDDTVLSSFWQFGFTIGLLVIGLSKERNEDEMMMSLRLNSVFMAFFAGIMAHLIFSLMELIQEGNLDSLDPLYTNTTGYILLVYIIGFHIAKMTVNK
ncbi:MAG: hypothetical protein RBS37_10335 [Bacteroidales bacterium]|jgi:hypothetical protein|nr:hypothetical protein [Bacteroidales bacterium]